MMGFAPRGGGMITETIVAGVIVSLFSAITGASTSEIRGLIDYRRTTLRNLAFSKVRTLDRLSKIRTAVEMNIPNTVDDELWHLGGELDRYLSALSGLRGPRELTFEWQTYEKLQTIIMTHDFTELDSVIDRLAPEAD